MSLHEFELSVTHDCLYCCLYLSALDTYSHVAPGLQEAAANRFDNILIAESKLDKELKELVRS